MDRRSFIRAAGSSALAYAGIARAAASRQYGPGVTDDEIKIGQTVAYSGSASGYAPWGLTHLAYFESINASGGINGRKIRLISLDDAGSPSKTVEQARKLVEAEEVVAIFGSLGAAGINATKKYLAAKGVPQLFLGLGANVWGPPPAFKWATIWSPDHRTETRVYAEDILKNHPGAKIAVFTQDDDTGRNQLAGLKEAFAGHKKMIVAEATYQTTDPSAESQILTLRSSGADVLVNMASPKFAAQAIRRSAEIGWKPVQYLFSFSSSVKGTLEPAGLENAKNVFSATYIKDPSNPSMKDDGGVQEYLAWAKKWHPRGDPNNVLSVQGYSAAQLLVHVLQRCGDTLTRDNINAQAKSVKGLQLSMLLPGVTIDTTPDDVSGIHVMKLQQFNGERWSLANR